MALSGGPARGAIPWDQQTHLTASDGGNGGRFGTSVAISGDTAIVGAVDGTVNGVYHPPEAYVFSRVGSDWTEQQILRPPQQDVPPPVQAGFPEPAMDFGRSVAISGDTAVVGARRDIRCTPSFCSYYEYDAYVFVRSGSTWFLQQRLTMAPPGTAGGTPSVAISGDTIVVGAPSGSASYGGDAFVWVRNGTLWSQQADLTGPNLSYFGFSVAINGDTAVVGAPFEMIPGGHEAGAAYVVTRVGTAWSQPQKLTGSDTSDFDDFGYAVTVSGGTVVVGAPNHDFTPGPQDTSDEGAAYVFVRNGATWQQQQEMSGDRSQNEEFGAAVSLSGETVIVGTGFSDAALVFERNQAVWLLQRKIDAPAGASFFGLAVGISGETAVVGASGESQAQGGAYVYLGSDDTDGDGLPDDWETSGVTIDGVFLDLPAMGADPMHKDVYVHVDVMQPDPAQPQVSFAPDPHALKLVSDAFFLAPVENPDGKPGIHLHVDAGPNSVMDPVTGHLWGGLSRSGTVPFQPLVFQTPPQTIAQAAPTFAASRAIDFVATRRGAVFRYALFCNQVSDEAEGQADDIPGTSFFISVVSSPGTRRGTIREASTFMHELGHDLGLHHGGGDEVNFKPNYISIMNYRFNTIGLLNPNTPTRSIDYSRRELATLDETALDELVGIDDPDGHLTAWNPHARDDVPSGANHCAHDGQFFRAFYPSQALDWNCDGAKTPTTLVADVNSDGKCVVSADAVLSTVPAGDDVVFAAPIFGEPHQIVVSGANRKCETVAVGGDRQITEPETQEEPQLLNGYADWPALDYDADGAIGTPESAFRARQALAVTDGGTFPIELPFFRVLVETPPELLDETDAAPLDEVALSPSSGPAPLLVDFDGGASTAVHGTITDWAWDFGDGATGSGATTRHTYDTPGEYFASLTVTDDHGHVNLVPLRHLVTVGSAGGATPIPTPTPGGPTATPGPSVAATPTPSAGAVDRSFTATATNDFGFVLATATQPDGRTIVGGRFESFAGCARFDIARLNADGSCDPTFDAGATFTDSKRLGVSVNALALQPDGKILVGVDSVSGSGPNDLVRLNVDGTVDAGFDASGIADLPGVEHAVLAIAVQADGRIVVGGRFDYRVNGQPKGGLARLQSNGSIDTSFMLFGSPNSQVEAIAVQTDGKVIAGGTFVRFGSTAMPGLARVNADGSRDATFNDLLCNFSSVYALALQPDGKFIAFGGFSVGPQCNTAEEDTIARFEADGTRDPDFTDPFAGRASSEGRGLALQSDGRVIVGGIIGASQPSNLARLDPDGTLDGTFAVGTGIRSIVPGQSRVSVLSVSLHADGKIIVAGDYNNFDDGPVQDIVQLNADGSRDLGFDSNGPGQNSEVYALLKLPGDKLLVGMVSPQSQFGDKVNAARRNGVGRLNADGTTDATFTSPFAAGTTIGAMALQPDGRYVVGGSLYLPGSQASRALARLDVDGTIDPDFAPPLGVTGNALAVQTDGKIIATGDGFLQDGIVRLNAADGSVDGAYVPGFHQQTATSFIVQPDGKLLVGGRFSGIGNVERNNVARLNANGSVDTGFDPGSGFADVNGNTVRTMLLQADGKILVGGNFSSFDGIARPGIARLNANGSLDDSFVPVNPNTAQFVGTQGVGAFAVQPDGKVVVGPALTGLATSPFRLFRLNPDGSLDQTFPLRSGLGCDNCVIHGITLQSGGAIVIGGDFDVVDGTPRLALARLLPDGAAPLPTSTAAPTVTPSPPIRTATPSPTPVVAPGFVPPDKAIKKCEDATAADLLKLAACLRGCHAKQADLAAKGKRYDEEACETGGPKSCRGKYDKASGALVTKAECPACLDPTARGLLADAVAGAIDREVGDVYCAGDVPFGDDDPGVVPPDVDVRKCELAVAKGAAAFASCLARCQIKHAGEAFKGKTFDASACDGIGQSSCRAKFDAASGKLEQRNACPPCLNAPARGIVADTVRVLAAARQAQLYCAGTELLH